MFFGSVNNRAAATAEAETELLPMVLPLDIGWPGSMPSLRGITYLLDYEDCCSAKEWADVEILLLHLRNIHPSRPPFRIKRYEKEEANTFEDAIGYINAVKDAFKDNCDKYKEFLDLLNSYRKDRSVLI